MLIIIDLPLAVCIQLLSIIKQFCGISEMDQKNNNSSKLTTPLGSTFFFFSSVVPFYHKLEQSSSQKFATVSCKHNYN